MKNKIYYYENELTDDFSGTDINTKAVPNGFRYIHKNPLWLIIRFLVCIIALPVARIISFLRYGTRVRNKKALKAAKGKGYFIYANHTLVSGDAFHPNIVCRPLKTRIVVGADAVSLPLLKNLVVMLGGMPLPSARGGYRNFLSGVETHLKHKNAIVIYPEAHIWPYYTGIRPFSSDSFLYPVKFDSPTFALTTVHKKRRFRSLPKCVLYVDGPFYPDNALGLTERKNKLRDEVYNAMTERSLESDYDRVTYARRPLIEELAETITYDVLDGEIAQPLDSGEAV